MARGDDRLRDLERLAAGGDPSARMALHDERARRGLPLLPDQVISQESAEWATESWHGVTERWRFSNGYGADVTTYGGMATLPDGSVDQSRGRFHWFVPTELSADGLRWRPAFNVGRPTLGTTEDVRPHEAEIVQDRLLWVLSWKPKRTNPVRRKRRNPPDPQEVARELEEERMPPGMFAKTLKQECGDTPEVREIVKARRAREREWIDGWVPDLRDTRPAGAGGEEGAAGWLTNPDERSRDLERRAAHDPSAQAALEASRNRLGQCALCARPFPTDPRWRDRGLTGTATEKIEGRTRELCMPCAAQRELADFESAAKWSGYLAGPTEVPGVTGTLNYITNFVGFPLAAVVGVSQSGVRGWSGSHQTNWTAVDRLGRVWYGRNAGGGMHTNMRLRRTRAFSLPTIVPSYQRSASAAQAHWLAEHAS